MESLPLDYIPCAVFDKSTKQFKVANIPGSRDDSLITGLTPKGRLPNKDGESAHNQTVDEFKADIPLNRLQEKFPNQNIFKPHQKATLFLLHEDVLKFFKFFSKLELTDDLFKPYAFISHKLEAFTKRIEHEKVSREEYPKILEDIANICQERTVSEKKYAESTLKGNLMTSMEERQAKRAFFPTLHFDTYQAAVEGELELHSDGTTHFRFSKPLAGDCKYPRAPEEFEAMFGKKRPDGCVPFLVLE